MTKFNPHESRRSFVTEFGSLEKKKIKLSISFLQGPNQVVKL